MITEFIKILLYRLFVYGYTNKILKHLIDIRITNTKPKTNCKKFVELIFKYVKAI